MFKVKTAIQLLTFVLLSTFPINLLAEIITSLPGLDAQINFKQYSGYITVNETANTRLFYWYVESQSDPVNDPLVLWLNGGPGCSSFGGFLGELGPFYIKKNLTLGINQYSWNKHANVIFLEAPAGVGFSKTDTAIPYTDDKTAIDSMVFLIKFFEIFPQLKSLKFYITGESYAGHYIPTLAAKVLEYNEMASIENIINLKGLMIGNPLTALSIDLGATVEFIYSHHLISIETYSGLKENCNFIFPNVGYKQSIDQTKCDMFQTQATKEMGNINPYDIYVDVCLNGHSYSRSNGFALLKKIAHSNFAFSAFARGLLKTDKLKFPYDPCRDNYLFDYLNEANVQKAIHAEPTKWVDCSDIISDKWSQKDFAASMIPYYTDILFKNRLKILVYSGDVDTIVSATSTRYWLHSLHLNNTKPWTPWIDSRGQVGGYTFASNEISFATVRGAGHEVPTFQPLRAYEMFMSYLDGLL